MKLYDPKRPRNSRRQALLLDGAIAPTFTLTPIEPGKVRAMVFLHTEGNSYRDFHFELGVNEVLALLLDFEADPEKSLKKYFKYEVKAAPAKEVDLFA